MANLMRYSQNENALDDLFRGFFMRPVLRFDGRQEIQIKLDVSENDNGYVVHAEIPGAKKEDIHVSIDGNQVTISSEVKNERDIKEGDRLLRSERFFGKVSRTFALDQDLDEEASNAKFTDGVLELNLSKRNGAKSKSIAIQ